MAIAAGSIVSPKTAGIGLNVQGPLFGIVESGTGPFTVLWFNGERVDSIVLINLDEILAGNGSTAALLVGRRVQVTSPSGQNNWGIGICIDVFNRNGSDVALIQNEFGYYIEALASQCVAVQ